MESILEEIIAEKFPKLGEKIISQTMEANRNPKQGTQEGQQQDI